jgi:hypothetical protein
MKKKLLTINRACSTSTETISSRLLLQVRVFSETADIESVSRIIHGLRDRFYPAIRHSNRFLKTGSLEPFYFLMYFCYYHTSNMSGRKWFSRCIAIEQNCIITNRTGQDMREQTANRVRILTKQESRTISMS